MLLIPWLAVFLMGSAAAAGELKVGDRAPDFALQDPTGKAYTLEAPEFRGKVLSIFYVDPDESDMNEHVSEALKRRPTTRSWIAPTTRASGSRISRQPGSPT
jgi:hypothetical protein